jgi:hypothetical protein
VSGPRRRGKQRGGGRPDPARTIDLWRPVPELAPPEPIRPAVDPGAVVRSLGTPPLPGQGAVADHYIAAVVERAAGLATALAAAGGLLADADDD